MRLVESFLLVSWNPKSPLRSLGKLILCVINVDRQSSCNILCHIQCVICNTYTESHDVKSYAITSQWNYTISHCIITVVYHRAHYAMWYQYHRISDHNTSVTKNIFTSNDITHYNIVLSSHFSNILGIDPKLIHAEKSAWEKWIVKGVMLPCIGTLVVLSV